MRFVLSAIFVCVVANVFNGYVLRPALGAVDEAVVEAVVEAVEEPEQSDGATQTKPDEVENPGQGSEEVTDADRILNLQKTVETDQVQLENLANEYEKKQQEFQKAEQDLTELALEIETQKALLQKHKDNNKKLQANELEQEIKQLEERAELRKADFDLVHRARDTLQKQIDNLTEKSIQDQESLNRLRGSPSPEIEVEAGTQDNVGATAPAEITIAGSDEASESVKVDDADDTNTDKLVTSEDVIRAVEERKEKVKEAEQAEQEMKDVAERIVRLEKDLQLEQDSFALVIERLGNLQHILQAQQEGLKGKKEASAPSEEIKELQQGVAQTTASLGEASAEYRAKLERITDLRQQLSTVKDEKLDSERVVAQKSAQAEVAKFSELLVSVQEGIRQWFRLAGPKVLIVFAIGVVLWIIARLFSRGLAFVLSLLKSRATSERESRGQTLIHILNNIVTLFILVGSTLVALNVGGVPMNTLLGGAAVVGLAIAFATQSVLRDYFHGLLILLENQYRLNDEVMINELHGKVEDITLRLTVLRDFEGNTHFIPNGQINAVTNRSYIWSRAVVEVEFSAKADLDEMTAVLTEIANELCGDPVFGAFVIGVPEMLGISDFDTSTVKLKFGIKTRPDKKAVVRRELLRRIKNKFDEISSEQDKEETIPMLV